MGLAEQVREIIAWALMIGGTIFAIWFAGWKAKMYLDKMYVPRTDFDALKSAFDKFSKRTSDDCTLRKKEGQRMERLVEALEKAVTK